MRSTLARGRSNGKSGVARAPSAQGAQSPDAEATVPRMPAQRSAKRRVLLPAADDAAILTVGLRTPRGTRSRTVRRGPDAFVTRRAPR